MFSTTDELQFKGSAFLLGNFRDDEVPEDGFLMDKIKLLEHSEGQINVAMIAVSELTTETISKMLSFKLCLPLRHVKELARLVFQKTRGHALFVNAFLRSMIGGGVISFSVKTRRWTWDDTAIDLQVISEDVAGFLTKKLSLLPNDVRETLKVVSCFGQVNIATIKLLDQGQFVPNMIQVRSPSHMHSPSILYIPLADVCFLKSLSGSGNSSEGRHSRESRPSFCFFT